MPGDDDATCGEIEAAIAFVTRRISEKDTFGGAWGKFVC
jgi:hypothetical protein